MKSCIVKIILMQAARPSIDLFKAIFAESSEESNVSSDDSDMETVPTFTAKSHSDGISLNPLSNQNSSQWQDLSAVTNYSLDQNVKDPESTLSIPTHALSQDHGNKKQSISDEGNRPQDHDKCQPIESYGPSLPPGKINVNNAMKLLLWLFTN